MLLSISKEKDDVLLISKNGEEIGYFEFKKLSKGDLLSFKKLYYIDKVTNEKTLLSISLSANSTLFGFLNEITSFFDSNKYKKLTLLKEIIYFIIESTSSTIMTTDFFNNEYKAFIYQKIDDNINVQYFIKDIVGKTNINIYSKDKKNNEFHIETNIKTYHTVSVLIKNNYFLMQLLYENLINNELKSNESFLDSFEKKYLEFI